MQASSPSRLRFGIRFPIGLSLNGNTWPISLEKAYRPTQALKSGSRGFTGGLLNRIRIVCMGWLTVLLVALAVAGLVGTTWVRLARR
jgi:hypothetical protein